MRIRSHVGCRSWTDYGSSIPFQGRSVHIINLSVLKCAMRDGAEYIDLAGAREIEGAVMTEQLEHVSVVWCASECRWAWCGFGKGEISVVNVQGIMVAGNESLRRFEIYKRQLDEFEFPGVDSLRCWLSLTMR